MLSVIETALLIDTWFARDFTFAGGIIGSDSSGDHSARVSDLFATEPFVGHLARDGALLSGDGIAPAKSLPAQRSGLVDSASRAAGSERGPERGHLGRSADLPPDSRASELVLPLTIPLGEISSPADSPSPRPHGLIRPLRLAPPAGVFGASSTFTHTAAAAVEQPTGWLRLRLGEAPTRGVEDSATATRSHPLESNPSAFLPGMIAPPEPLKLLLD